MHTRRHLLGTLAVAVAAAGCTGAGDEANAPDSVRLDELSMQNADEEAHQLQLAIEGDGEMIHLGTHELDGGESRTINGEWSDESASYRVHAKLDDASIQTADVTEGVADGADCVRVLARIGEDGALSIWNGANCGSAGDDSELERAQG
jgi:hypothetical protein